jgi:hypothetical protein
MSHSYHICAECNCNLDRSSYGKSQWSSKKGPGVLSHCATSCVAGGGSNAHSNTSRKKNNIDPTETALLNNATCATFSHDALVNPFASGSFHFVAKGKYTHGDHRAGEDCVCKWFKTGGVCWEIIIVGTS